MERNDALLRKVGDVIAAEPERYDQRVYVDRERSCGAVACIAGHAALLGSEPPLSFCAGDVLGLEADERRLFDPQWIPAGDPSVPLHEEEIKQQLWEWAKPRILRGAIRGLPEWYKQRLFDRQFDGGSS